MNVISISWSKPIRVLPSNREAIPQAAGVYEILVQMRGGNRKRLYVGSAENLRVRYLQHIQGDEPNPCLGENLRRYICWFRFAVVEDERERLDAKRELHAKYEAEYECNERNPVGSGSVKEILLLDEE